MRRVARAERVFEPSEYDAMAPGLFAWLDARARRGLGRYRRSGRRHVLGISFLEARPAAPPGV